MKVEARRNFRGVVVRAVEAGERAWLADTLAARWGEPLLGRGRVWRVGELDALVAVGGGGCCGGERLGIATFAVEGDDAELVTLDALVPGRGAGRALIDAVVEAARDAGARRLRVMTTNDNVRALRLYQRAGFRLEALRPGAVDAARERKPSIPFTSDDGIPIRDELDLVRDLVAVLADEGPS